MELAWVGTLGMRVRGTVAGGGLAEGRPVRDFASGGSRREACSEEAGNEQTGHMGDLRQTLKALAPQPES